MRNQKNNVEQASRLSSSNVVQASSLSVSNVAQASSLLKKHRQDACSTLIKAITLIAILAICTISSFAENANYKPFTGNFSVAEIKKSTIYEFKDGKQINAIKLRGSGPLLGIFHKLTNGNLLVTFKYGIFEYSPDGKKVVFEYNCKKTGYCVSWCKRLENGNTLIAETGKQEYVDGDKKQPVVNEVPHIIEVSPDGKIIKRIDFEFSTGLGKEGRSVYQMRGVRQIKNGSFVVAHQNAGIVNEYSSNGKFLREILNTKGTNAKAKGSPISVFECYNENIVIGTAEGSKGAGVYEINKTNEIVWSLTYEDMPKEAMLQYLTDVKKLKNGNYLIVNNCGHNKNWNGYPLLEVSPNKKIVKVFKDNKILKSVVHFRLEDE